MKSIIRQLCCICPLFFLICLLHACTSGAQEQTTLSDQQLSKIMADVSVAEAATNGLSGFPKDSLMQVYFKQIFELHGITLETYEKDLRILTQDLPRMERVVKDAEDLLTEGKKGEVEQGKK